MYSPSFDSLEIDVYRGGKNALATYVPDEIEEKEEKMEPNDVPFTSKPRRRWLVIS